VGLGAGVVGGLVAGAFGLASLPGPTPPSAPMSTITTPVRATAPEVVAPKWSAVDREVLKLSNKSCDPVSDDVTYEDCVIGDFVLTQEKLVTLDDYTYDDNGYIVFA
jgi:hypothetical protein